MADRVIPPGVDASDFSSYKILVGGSDIGGLYGLLSIFISKSVNKIASAQIILADGDVAAETFEVSSESLFLPGAEVEIQLGYNNSEDTIFKGIIVKHGIKTKPDRTSMLILELKDAAVKMTIGRKNKYFEEVTDSDVIEEIAGTYGLDVEVEATEVTHPKMVQYFVSDWDFILSRAEMNGQLVYTDDGKLITKKPEITDSPVELAYGHNVIEFEADMDARDQYAASLSKAWDYTGQEVLEEEGTDPGLDDHGNVSAAELSDVVGLENLLQQHTGKIADQELKTWADAKLIRSRLAKIKGSVKTIGFKDLKPGDTVEFAGFGDRFNGKAFISAVYHSLSAETSWYTTIQFGLDQEWFYKKFSDISDAPASGLVPPINGLHTGIVTNIHEDPDGEFRVQVRVPIIDPEDAGVWARVATLDAGENRGFFWRPEVDDEVVIGFLNDDPREPIVLGTMHSSGKPSPIEPSEENNEKGIVTRSEMKLMFDDDLVSTTLETPAGNKLLMSEDEGGITIEDENGNKIQMSADGIVIESAADMTLKASGDITVEGTNLTNSASAQYAAEGSSGAEVTSGGQVVIEGALVAIN
ncbi:MAG: type VI secretion system tip protein VgrG [Bacteroidota bacterium]